jgi:hypothetical protein
VRSPDEVARDLVILHPGSRPRMIGFQLRRTRPSEHTLLVILNREGTECKYNTGKVIGQRGGSVSQSAPVRGSQRRWQKARYNLDVVSRPISSGEDGISGYVRSLPRAASVALRLRMMQQASEGNLCPRLAWPAGWPPTPTIAPTFSSGSQGAVMDAAAWGTEKLKGGGQPLHAQSESAPLLQAFVFANHVGGLEGLIEITEDDWGCNAATAGDSFVGDITIRLNNAPASCVQVPACTSAHAGRGGG